MSTPTLQTPATNSQTKAGVSRIAGAGGVETVDSAALVGSGEAVSGAEMGSAAGDGTGFEAGCTNRRSKAAWCNAGVCRTDGGSGTGTVTIKRSDSNASANPATNFAPTSHQSQYRAGAGKRGKTRHTAKTANARKHPPSVDHANARKTFSAMPAMNCAICIASR
jgi:hypothetical protein